MTAEPVTAAGASAAYNDYLKQLQAGTDAAKQKMAENVANGVNADAAKTLGTNFNTFLKLLTTQLQFQDPTAPMDTNQFTQELVQFSAVEQQINSNKLLQKLVDASGASGVKSLLGYVGQYVQVPANNKLLIQDSQSAFAYTLDGAAKKVTITVTDSAGKAVATIDGPGAQGSNNIVWNGEDSNGNDLPDGVYGLAIAAIDTSGNAVKISDTKMVGKVTGVQNADSDGNDLMLGGNLVVKDTDVTAVYSQSMIPQPTT